MCQTFALPIIVHVIFVQWGQLTCATRSYPIAISHHFRLIYLARVPYIYRPCKILFPCNFQRTFTKVICYVYTTYSIILSCKYLLAFSPTCTVNWCYTHISMLHRESSCLALPTVAIVATTIVYRLILHWSVYYLDHQTVTLTLTTISTTI